MPLPIFPELAGIDIETSETLEFETKVFKTIGAAVRHCARQTGKRLFKVPVNLLIEEPWNYKEQLTELMSFFAARKGQYGAFWYSNPTDNAVELQALPALGNSHVTNFQLVRTFGSGDNVVLELIQNVNAVTAVYLNDGGIGDDDVLVSANDYTVDVMTGIVTFDTAPTTGQIIKWSGSFYYRCFFDDDKLTFGRIAANGYNCKDLSFVGSVANVVQLA